MVVYGSKLSMESVPGKDTGVNSWFTLLFGERILNPNEECDLLFNPLIQWETMIDVFWCN